MADYFTQYSLMLPDLTVEEFAWWKRLSALLDEAEEGVANPELASVLGYAPHEFFADDLLPAMWRFHEESGERSIHFEDDAGYANLEVLSRALHRFLKRFRPESHVAIHYANTCSRARLNGFGGGLIFITSGEVHWRSTTELAHELWNAHSNPPRAHR